MTLSTGAKTLIGAITATIGIIFLVDYSEKEARQVSYRGKLCSWSHQLCL